MADDGSLPLTDFQRGIVVGKLVASQTFVEHLDELPETLGISPRLREVRERFARSIEGFQRLIAADDAERAKRGLTPYATARRRDLEPSGV